MTKFKYLSGVSTLEFDAQTCVGCGMCAMVCPHGVFRLADGKAQLAGRDDCMECGACQLNCPTAAIAVDSGVGCAAAMIRAALTGSQEPTCGPEPEAEGACCEPGRQSGCC